MALCVWLQDLGEGARPRTARKVGSGAEGQKCRRETKKYEEERRFELWKCQCRPGMDGWIERQGKTVSASCHEKKWERVVTVIQPVGQLLTD